jgi:ribosome-associated protein
MGWRRAGAAQQEETVIDTGAPQPAFNQEELLSFIQDSLDEDKAVDPVTIDLAGKTSFADHMVVVSGTSQRHLTTMAEKLLARLKARGIEGHAEGLNGSDWVLIDTGDVIVHLFRPEVRALYNLEKLWGVALPEGVALAAGMRA